MGKEKEKLMSCCICGKFFKGFGNNPYPVKETGRCCDECNDTVVIPARLAEIIKERNR